MKKRKNTDELIPLTEFFDFEKNTKNNVRINGEKNKQPYTEILNELKSIKALLIELLTRYNPNNMSSKNVDVFKQFPKNKMKNIIGYGDSHGELLSELKEFFRKRRKGMIDE